MSVRSLGIFQKADRAMSSSLSLFVSASPLNLIFPPPSVCRVDVSLAGSKAGTEWMWQRRRRETQSSLLCFITPFSMCLEGLLRGSWPRAEATGHSDLLAPLFPVRQHPISSWPPTSATVTHRDPQVMKPHLILNARQGNTPTLSPQRLRQYPAHSHNPMVRVLALPDLQRVLPLWDVTSLNTHFLSLCFWFPLWIDWPANNAAPWCALA